MIFQSLAWMSPLPPHPSLSSNTKLLVSASTPKLHPQSEKLHWICFSLTLPSSLFLDVSLFPLLCLPLLVSLFSTGTITLCFSCLCKSNSSVFSFYVSVEQGFLGLQAAGQGHENGVDILTLPWVLGWCFKQQHIVGISKLQCHVGGNLEKHHWCVINPNSM